MVAKPTWSFRRHQDQRRGCLL